uniref:Uncharacterized protein n=1 Tax=Anguilla anguilla TaxID=7936 RepID=A0A0E9Q0P7_ANGAN
MIRSAGRWMYNFLSGIGTNHHLPQGLKNLGHVYRKEGSDCLNVLPREHYHKCLNRSE